MQQFLETIQDPALRIALAVLLGGIIGLERELHGKSAGLRTNILICAGSCALMIVSVHFATSGSFPNADPARIAAQVVSGIGFIGAGAILQSRGSVIGLTTAATIWVVAGVGLCVGAGLFAPAILITLFMLFVLVILGRIETIVFRSRMHANVIRVIATSPEVLSPIHQALDEIGLVPDTIRTSRTERGVEVQFGVTCGVATLRRLELSLARATAVSEVSINPEEFDR
ncbi:MAG: MgtC/SapB family protein [Deltaproteobacteria bacterium]|nr:MgtC/SapB family protein [Deltaproteobacteria bacterium]